jgi:K+-transporting ATPase ATPase C chain
MTGISQILFPEKANGSLIISSGGLTGSELIGQKFTSAKYFHGRPSANDYDGINSEGSNLGPTNKKLFDRAENLASLQRMENSCPSEAKIPSDLVLSSASGLDPHISLESAVFQAYRIGRKRKIDKETIIKMIDQSVERPYFNMTGSPYVNVLKLNLALDAMDVRK